jgi:hypothetical protein
MFARTAMIRRGSASQHALDDRAELEQLQAARPAQRVDELRIGSLHAQAASL